jgi:RIO kinase 1
MSIGTSDLERIVTSLAELELISGEVEPIKSGKEASVFRCREHPASERGPLALKIYRARDQRSFKNDAIYREGSLLDRIGGGNTRQARALRSGTRFGRQVQEHTWAAREWEVMQTLYGAGLPVPEPIYNLEGAILMELFVDGQGRTAAPLGRAQLASEVARPLFDALCDDIEQMLWLDLLHGDLSPYNVLWNGESYRIIDFPQAIDPRFNGSAAQLLERDIRNVATFCARFGDVPDAALTSAEMWRRFQLGEPP